MLISLLAKGEPFMGAHDSLISLLGVSLFKPFLKTRPRLVSLSVVALGCFWPRLALFGLFSVHPCAFLCISASP